MKYKKKEEIIGRTYSVRYCTSNQHYATFTQGRANQVALSDASFKIPQWIDSGGCRWYTSPEVRNAKYVASSIRAVGLQPKPQCGYEDRNTGSTLCDQTDLPNRGKTIITYEPGGSRPPCSGGNEGICSAPTQTDEPALGSRWVEGPSGEQANVTLEYEYRWALNNGSVRISGSGRCPSAPIDTWKPFTKSIGPINIVRRTRCTVTKRAYDCCCTCPREEVKVPQIVPGLAPCYSYNNASQAQLESLLKAATAALVVGACAAAVVFAAKYTALFLAGLAANPVTAGCAIRMVPLIVPCIVQDDES